MQAFLRKLEHTLQYFTNEEEQVILCGDFNIDTGKLSIAEYQHLALSYGFRNNILAPTRVTPASSTTIYPILSNIDSECITTAVLTENISGNLPILIYVSSTHLQAEKQTTSHPLRIDYENSRKAIQETQFLGPSSTNANATFAQFASLLQARCAKSRAQISQSNVPVRSNLPLDERRNIQSD